MIKKTLAMLIPLLVFLTHTTGFCFAKFGVVSHSPSLLETGNSQLETDNKDWLGNQWTFTYDAAGRLTGMSSPKVAQTFLSAFSYDNAGRLSSWSVDGIAGRTITYDAANRRIRDDITAGAIPSPTLQRTALNTFDAADKLISSSVRYGQGADSTEHITETFQYDGNGALTNWTGGRTSSSAAFTYDALGRLATDGEALTCTYDALGNRLQTVGCCSITPEIWIPNHADPLKRPLMMYDAEGDEVYYYYIWGGNRLLGVIENGEFWDEDDTLFVAHSDEIGSVIAFTDLSGNLLYSANYGPHGEDWGSIGYNPTPFAWLGGYGVQTLETDTPLKLYLTRHRVYSATLNRFLSADPIGLAGGNNLYAYGEGNPMAYIDPLGLCSQSSGWEYAWEMTGAIASGFAEGFGNGLLGVVLGDFGTDTSISGTIGQVGLGLIPVAGQLADVRDIVANGGHIWDDPGSGAAWLGLGGAVLGVMPFVGDIAKGAIKGSKAAAVEAGQAALKGMDNAAKGSLKSLSNTEIKMLQRAGEDIHLLKGGKASKLDLYKDANGNIFSFPKGGVGEGNNLYININDFK